MLVSSLIPEREASMENYASAGKGNQCLPLSWLMFKAALIHVPLKQKPVCGGVTIFPMDRKRLLAMKGVGWAGVLPSTLQVVDCDDWPLVRFVRVD
jgi:hypothetical protein